MIEDTVYEDSVESDGADYVEYDEAVAEDDESDEDIGERLRRRRVSRYRPGFGVGGLMVRGPDGRARRLPFPTKLATASETNRGLAKQEVGRRVLEQRMDRLEASVRKQQRNGATISGMTSLLLGGGLSVWGAVSAANSKAQGGPLNKWAAEEGSKMAAITSLTQLATSGARLAVHGRYHRTGFGVAADVFAASQLAAFAVGRVYKPPTPSNRFAYATLAAVPAPILAGLQVGDRVITVADGKVFEVVNAGPVGGPLTNILSLISP